MAITETVRQFGRRCGASGINARAMATKCE
jgi:hypothetical protein